MIAVALVVRAKKLSTMRIGDVAGICIAAGYAVGRTGCWAVGDDYGTPWNSPWAVSFPNGAPPSTALVMNQEFGTAFAIVTHDPALAALAHRRLSIEKGRLVDAETPPLPLA